jgi:osmotically-inducible protein OsmY
MLSLLRLIVVVALVVLVLWFLKAGNPGLFARAGQETKQELGSAAREAKKAWDGLDKEAIAAELKETGRVVRRKSAQVARQVAEATEDGRTSAAIKARYALDPNLSALDISVDTTEGVVTLAGRVESPAEVARAMEIALEHDNVQEVVSTLQVIRKDPASAQAR